MSLSKICLKISLQLTAVTLAATLTGCSSNPSSDDAWSSVSATSTTQSRSDTSAAGERSGEYEPVLVRINEPVPLAEGHPNEYVVQVGDTLWDLAATFLKDPWF